MPTTLMPDIERLQAALVAAQEERDQRPKFVDGAEGREYEWVRFERNAMWREVNLIRTERGLRPTLLSSIVSAEQLAFGHSDYTF